MDKCDFQPMVKNQNIAVRGNRLGKTVVFALKLHIFLQKRKISDKTAVDMFPRTD